ncbi:MAG: DUF2207 domain-containing protein, partial [Nitrospirota bacterium]|nr:DUF2207 domain-containing protein [Nitrospirota bacterium]
MAEDKSGLLIAVSIAVFVFFSPFLSSPAESYEKIISFRSDISVRHDATIVVKETIRVQSEGVKIRHGIYRDFPTRYRDRLGNSSVVGFEVKEVLRDNIPEPFHIENRPNGKRVYIGSKDRMLPSGEYTYTLVYGTDRQLGFFRDYDELYWNVTGNGWEVPIGEVTTAIELPGDSSRRLTSFAGYTGPQGAKGQDFTQTIDESGIIRFSTTRSLAPREGLTIAVAWPKGYVDEPTPSERSRNFVTANPGVIIGPAGLMLLLFYYVLIWIRVGKDPDPGIIMTRYTPPDGMTPAVMRFITKMGYDQKTFASSIINMAVKGHLLISEEGDAYLLERKDNGKSPLTAEEQKINSALFSTARKITLEQSNHKRIRNAVNTLKSYLELKYEKIYFVTNKGFFISGIVLSSGILFLTGLGDAAAKDTLPIFLFMCVWLTIWSIGVTGLLAQVISRWRTAFRGKGSGLLAGGGALFLTLFSIPFVAGEIAGMFMLGYATSAMMVFFLVVTIFINYLFYHLLKAPTRAGRHILDSIEGFRIFLAASEKDRMNMMNPPGKTPELFERYLPYALALDVEQLWAEQFSGVIAGAAAEGGAGGYSPAWYSGALWHSVSTGDFASSFGDSLSGAVAASSTAPGSSSGSGGGGSSGGGGGGGGGGG